MGAGVPGVRPAFLRTLAMDWDCTLRMRLRFVSRLCVSVPGLSGLVMAAGWIGSGGSGIKIRCPPRFGTCLSFSRAHQYYPTKVCLLGAAPPNLPVKPGGGEAILPSSTTAGESRAERSVGDGGVIASSQGCFD